MIGPTRFTAVAAACLLLGACATTTGPRKDDPAAASPQAAPAVEPVAAETPPAAPETVAPESPPAPPPDLWQRLARGLQFARCEDDEAVTRRMRAYAESPGAFRMMMQRTLPGLEYVLAAVEGRGLPTEFALLPMVESEFRHVQPRKGVAGMWQLTPATAREHGVRIDRDYDGRLDLAASTDAALALLHALRDQFPQDWRLVDMAYNAGHYRVAMAVAERERHGLELRVDQLALPATTHAHAAKLQALACLVRDAASHEIELPDADPDATLVAVPAAPGLDFELAARLSGIDMGRLQELNPAYLKRRVPRSGAYALVLPRPNAERLGVALARIPQSIQGTFAYTRVTDATEWQSLASRTHVPGDLLAALNGALPDQRIPAGTRLYLPAFAAAPARPR